jgi:O-antigen/teichoic acid export membrane protein
MHLSGVSVYPEEYSIHFVGNYGCLFISYLSMSFKKSFFKNISTFASFSYISQGFEFFSTIILSRLLLPEEYGFVAIILVFAGFMQLFASVGINASIVRSDYGRTFHQHLHSLSIWIGVALMLIMMLLAWPIGFFFGNMALVLPAFLVSFRFLFESISYVPSAVLSKQLDFRTLGIAQLIGSAFQISVTIVLAFLGFSYWSLILPMIFSPIVMYAIIIRKTRMAFRLFGFRAALRVFKKIKSLMGYLSLSNLFTYWGGNADKVVIARSFSEIDLGLYNRAFRFILIATRLITTIFSKVLLPSLKKLVENNGDANKEYLDIIRIVTLFNMPIVLVLLLFPNTLVMILWGKDWIGVAQYLPYVGILLMMQSMFKTLQPVFLLYGKEKILTGLHMVNSLLRVAVVIAGSFFSIIHMVSFMILFEIFINLPMQVYFGFYKSFGFKPSVILKYWVPVGVTSFGLLASVYLDNMVLRALVIGIFNLQLLWDMRKTIGETLHLVRVKIFT